MPLTSSHWGAFSAEWDGEKVTAPQPFASDPDPTPIISGIAELYDSPTRIRRPAVRKGWLEGGPGARREQRGAEPFVEVPWDEALDLVAGELKRVKEQHGNEAIFGGSYGWASAGRFHHAQGQLKRFLNLFGGFVDQVNNYSYGAGMVLLPHILGNNDLLLGRCTSWRSIIENTELFVAFGGIPPKNAQIESGGFAEHNLARFAGQAAARGMRTVNVSPVRADTLDLMNAEWWPARPGTDCAILLAMAHTLVSEERHDREFLERHATGFDRFADYLMNGRPGGFSAQWASAISGLPAQDIMALAR
ncbi:MAG: molybdopterin-dependent oxidoreductase, partial [Nitratireductor sp.]|nr:molybdopterin-dependent oxidoreductase [Nitratireductor sp.]